MSLPDLLDEATLRAELERLPEWRRDGSALLRSFSFPDFVTAFAFMTRVAELAEAAQHHPEWSNVYGRVEIRLTTHDAGGLTTNDVSLARAIDAVAS